MNSKFNSTSHSAEERFLGSRFHRQRFFATLALGVWAATLVVLPISAAQGEFANTKELGRAVAQYRDKDDVLQVVVAYNYSQRQHNSRWILIQMAVSSNRSLKIRREGIYMYTPDVRVIELATQRRFREDSQRVTALIQNSAPQRHPVEAYFVGRDGIQNIRFFAQPFGGTVQNELVTSIDRVMVGDLFFENPRGLWESGVYALTVESDRVKAELPITLN